MIDIDKIREYTGADDEFIGALFTKFLDHLDEDLAELVSEAEKEQWQNVRKKTHAMLSSARIFHLEEIVQLSLEIEQKVDVEDFGGLMGKTSQLQKLYKDFGVQATDFKKSLR